MQNRLARSGLATLVCFLLPAPSGAQVPQVGELRFVGATEVRIVDDLGRGRLTLSAGQRTRSLNTGGPRMFSAAAGPRGILLVLYRPGLDAHFFPVTNGRVESPRPVQLASAAQSSETVVGAVVSARPGGFVILSQYAQPARPTSHWNTRMHRISDAGQLEGTATRTSIRWPLADAVWEGGQFLLLLYYAAGAPENTRLCAVHMTVSGQAVEHPWWASRTGLIDESQLVRTGGRTFAVYRGGPRGTDLLRADVTNGSWASEPAPPTALGTIGGDEIFGLRSDGQVVRRPLAP